MINFIKDFSGIRNYADKNSPAWLTKSREEGWERFSKLGLPTTSLEEWKYTNITPFVKHQYSLTSDVSAYKPDAETSKFIDAVDAKIVFINGILSQELSDLEKIPSGISVEPLSVALRLNEKEQQSFFTRYTADESAFAALNRALWKEGTSIRIREKTVSNGLIHIVHLVSSKQPILTIPRTHIYAGKSSEATILESHVCFDDNQLYATLPLTDIYLEENAVLRYYRTQKGSLRSYHIGQTRVWQQRNANGTYFNLDAGSAISRHNLDLILNGEGSNAILNGLYSTFDDQLVDNHTFVDHRVPNCISNQLYKGILNGSSHAVFNGRILVHSIAQQTNSYQLNKNLILGKDARIDTKPQLEIFADDVKCTHGATIGQLNEDELFYLQSRCISRREAVRMLSRGFMEDIVATVPNETVREKMNQLLEPSFTRL